MEWHDVLFLHWPVKKEGLRPHIPEPLNIETFDGTAWLGIVPFTMSNIRPRYIPSVPYISNFPELNIRTYVNDGTTSGVWFHSLDASSWFSVQIARLSYSLNYYHADMEVKTTGDTIEYHSKRKSYEPGEFHYKGSYKPTGELANDPGSLENFLTKRYYLFSSDNEGTVYKGAISHDPWTLQNVEQEIDHLLIEGHPSPHNKSPVSALYASHETVKAWLPRRI